jgi:hypothetical protein
VKCQSVDCPWSRFIFSMQTDTACFSTATKYKAYEMAYEQAGGPSTPGRSQFTSNNPSDYNHQYQQRTLSGSGPQLSSSSAFGNEYSLPRSSSMRSINTSQSMQGNFGFGGMREASTPKSVRWEDASQSHAPSTPFQNSASSSSFGFNYQQPVGAQELQLRQSATNNHSQPNSSSQPVQQMQRFTPQPSLPNQFSLSTTDPNQARLAASTSSDPAASQNTRSAFNGTFTSPSKTPVAGPRPAAPRYPQAPAVNHQKDSKDVVIASRPAILARIKWNVIVLLVSWAAPYVGPTGRLYW